MARKQKEPQFLDLKQIARVTGVSYRTVRRWRDEGLLPRPAMNEHGMRKYWTSTQIAKWWKTLDRKVANSGHEGESPD